MNILESLPFTPVNSYKRKMPHFRKIPHFAPWREARDIYPVNMPDPIRKRFGYGQFWPLQPVCSQIVYARSYFPHPFQLHFSKEGTDHIMQNQPRSDLDGLVRVWPNASGLEASWCAGIIWPGFWQDATGPLPVSCFQTWFHSSTDVPDNIVQNQPRSSLVLADCVRFGPNGSSPEVSQCARNIRPASGQCFPADLDRMWIGSWLFMGMSSSYLESEGCHLMSLSHLRLFFHLVVLLLPALSELSFYC